MKIDENIIEGAKWLKEYTKLGIIPENKMKPEDAKVYYNAKEKYCICAEKYCKKYPESNETRFWDLCTEYLDLTEGRR